MLACVISIAIAPKTESQRILSEKVWFNAVFPLASIFQLPPRPLVCLCCAVVDCCCFLLYHGAKRNDIICHCFSVSGAAGEKNGTEIGITAAGRLLYHGAKRNDIICHVFRFPGIGRREKRRCPAGQRAAKGGTRLLQQKADAPFDRDLSLDQSNSNRPVYS